MVPEAAQQPDRAAKTAQNVRPCSKKLVVNEVEAMVSKGRQQLINLECSTPPSPVVWQHHGDVQYHNPLRTAAVHKVQAQEV